MALRAAARARGRGRPQHGPPCHRHQLRHRPEGGAPLRPVYLRPLRRLLRSRLLVALPVDEAARIAVGRALHEPAAVDEHPLAGLRGQYSLLMDDRELYDQAVAIADQAYAPYSNFHVGAAVLARDGRVFLGVNVENAAYPLGVCAEKTALTRAVTDGCKPGDLEAIGITASPCGGCRQWLWELGLDRVTYARANGEVVTTTPAELLPDTFEL